MIEPKLTPDNIEKTRKLLAPYIVSTPVVQWSGDNIAQLMGVDVQPFVKLEFLQHTGSFKPRGVFSNALNLPEEQLKRGIVTLSAGNHAIATAYVGKLLGVPAKIVMVKGANALRVEKTRLLGAKVLFRETSMEALQTAEEISANEGLVFIHPYNGPYTSLGTATIGQEFIEQAPDLDLVLIPIGGGGLASGMAAAIRQKNPNCQILGVEPEGAANMSKSFDAGYAVDSDPVQTIADSLGPPRSEPYSHQLCKENLDGIQRISESDIRLAMRLIRDDMKMMVEPAGAVATAAMLSTAKGLAKGKRVGLIFCGANISFSDWCEQAHMSC